MPTTSEIIEAFIKTLHIFDNVNITSRPHVVVNFCFNVSSFIATIKRANMNSGISQYKNCWKWDHTIFLYHLQETRCLNCNGLHKVKHHCHFTWYYKANFKTNPLVLKPNRVNFAPIPSNALTARATTR